MELFTNDAQAAEELKNGNVHALAYFYNLYHHQLYKFLYAYSKDPDLVQDMVQNSFVKLWEKRRQVNTSGNVKNWLFTLSKNLLFDSLRQTKFQNGVWTNYLKSSEADDKTLNEIVYKDYQRIVSSVLLKLPERNQEIFYLSRSHQLTNKEIAEQLNISVKAVEKNITKVLSFLKGFLKEQHILSLIILNLVLNTFLSFF